MAPEAAGIPAILTDQEVTRADLPANLVAFQEVILLTSRLAIQVAVQEAAVTAHPARVGVQEATCPNVENADCNCQMDGAASDTART
mmetsp:Transcript_22083/g.58433  ORF Transcript_22083/g.58433 Transcript_22083/m.58433 type:complete len:87 (+) Transcript_22083:1218-1478(+)